MANEVDHNRFRGIPRFCREGVESSADSVNRRFLCGIGARRERPRSDRITVVGQTPSRPGPLLPGMVVVLVGAALATNDPGATASLLSGKPLSGRGRSYRGWWWFWWERRSPRTAPERPQYCRQANPFAAVAFGRFIPASIGPVQGRSSGHRRAGPADRRDSGESGGRADGRPSVRPRIRR